MVHTHTHMPNNSHILYLYYTVGIIIASPTILPGSNRLFLKIITKSTISQPESTKRNPGCSLIDASVGAPRNPSRRASSWWPQPWHHAAARLVPTATASSR
jgi:hypothetical protein